MSYTAPEHQSWSEPTAEDRNWAMAAHLGALVSAWFALGLIAPLVVLLLAGQRSEFVRKHATESLNFQIGLLIYSIVAVVLGIVTLGIGLIVIVPVAIVVAVVALVLIIKAGVDASNGREFRYPLNIRFVS